MIFKIKLSEKLFFIAECGDFVSCVCNFIGLFSIKLLLFFNLIIFSGDVLSASNNSFEEKYYDACVTAATDLLEDFYMSRGEIRSKCECVKNRWIGDISFNSISWEGAGKNSATLFLIECSKNNIVNTFSNAVLNSEKIAYKRKNSKINTDEIKRIDGFGLCVGMRSYEEMHRVARDESAAFLGLNKSWFQAMYQNCEVKFNLR